MRIQFIVMPVLLWLIWQAAVLPADQTRRVERPGTTLDELLLNPLEERLFGDSHDDTTPRSGANAARSDSSEDPNAADRRHTATGDRQLLDDLGEDIEWKSQRDPIVQIGDQMMKAAHWISQNKTAQETQDLQQSIVQALDGLIQQTRRSNKARKSGTNNPPPAARRDSVKQPGDQSPAAESDAQSQARENLEENTERATQSLDMEEMQILIKEIWGHLPPKAREQMLKSYGERFLPQYEELIVEYFKRLAEGQEEGP